MDVDAPRAGESRPDSPHAVHAVQLYESDGFLADSVARFLADGLAAGEAALVVASASHGDDIARTLAARGVDVAAAEAAGRYRAIDAAATLAAFLVDGEPDAPRFDAVVGGEIRRLAGDPPRRVHVFGEMVALLWDTGKADTAVRLEALWNELMRRVDITLLCAYPVSAFDRDGGPRPFIEMCGAHEVVLPSESFPARGSESERLRAIALLQHDRHALIGERARLERRLDESLVDFFDNAPVGLHCVAADGTIVYANRAELDMLGYAAEEYVGHPVRTFHLDPAFADDLLARLARDETIREQPARLRAKDGSAKHVVVDANAFWRDGRFVHGRCFVRDISERQRAAAAQARLAAIVDSSDDAIIGKTLEGVITSWNAGAERIFGYTAAEMIGRPIHRLVPTDRRYEVAEILDAIRRGEGVEHHETERIRKDGTRIHVSLTVSPIRDASGAVVGASKIARDVTDRKLAEAVREELLAVAEQARAQAEAASRAKDEFLAMLGHELRNPLSAVRNAVITAQLDERRRKPALEIARRQTEQLARLLDDLLDVSRITQGRIVLRRERLYLADVIARAVETTRGLVEDLGHTLEVSLPAEALCVDGDPTRLEQVVVNLVSNAAKYTPGPGGRIELGVEREGPEAVLRVRDNGVGIDPALLPRIFDLFVQGERNVDRREGGLGIGLTVVRRLVEMHGGRIEARSQGRGAGSEFVVRLPALAPLRDTPVVPAERVVSGGARTRILVVEDNLDAAESLVMLLEVLGHQVRIAHDGVAALKAARTNRPDVMLVDISLPGIDGYEVARRMRADPELAGVMLIALTGYGRDEDRHRAIAAGFDHHLVKPIDPTTLHAVVARARESRVRSGSLLH
jgi:PAS domain S-box-containing protein